ncbi:hypothetical protein [Parafilimonas sp.]|uniref:hypothetical protein n=1 Tax=Parafilimonas sp. TaxID=1969739 RepID=UPI0039E30DD0
MERRSFLTKATVIASMLSAPFAGFAKRRKYDRASKGFKVDAGKDRFEKPVTLYCTLYRINTGCCNLQKTISNHIRQV